MILCFKYTLLKSCKINIRDKVFFLTRFKSEVLISEEVSLEGDSVAFDYDFEQIIAR